MTTRRALYLPLTLTLSLVLLAGCSRKPELTDAQVATAVQNQIYGDSAIQSRQIGLEKRRHVLWVAIALNLMPNHVQHPAALQPRADAFVQEVHRINVAARRRREAARWMDECRHVELTERLVDGVPVAVAHRRRRECPGN